MPRLGQYAIYLLFTVVLYYVTWRFHKELGFLELSFKPLPQTNDYIIKRLVTTVILAAVNIFFFDTLFNAFDAVSPENRKMKPLYIWSMAIPLVVIVGCFYVAIELSRSIAAEYRKLNVTDKVKPTLDNGLAWSAFASAAILLPLIGQHMLSSVCLLASLVFFIVYWVQVARHTRQLKTLQQRSEQFSFTV